MSALAALAALERELGARHRDCLRREGLTAQSSLALEAVIQAVRDAQKPSASPPICVRCGGLYHAAHECRAPFPVSSCTAYVTTRVPCRLAAGHAGPCEFPLDPHQT